MPTHCFKCGLASVNWWSDMNAVLCPYTNQQKCAPFYQA